MSLKHEKPASATPGRVWSRRRFLELSAASAAGLLVTPAYAMPTTEKSNQRPRTLSLSNLHTGEKVTRTYWADGDYVDESLTDINRVLRDHRSNEIHSMDPQLLDLLHTLQKKVGSRRAYEVISGYRSPQTNAALRDGTSGVAKKSLHMQGKAIDIRLADSQLDSLRKAALSLRAGGVGYYPRSNFLHVDTGRVRSWS